MWEHNTIKIQEIKPGYCKLIKLSKELQGTGTFYCYTRMHGSVISFIFSVKPWES
jgi:hypothetical protein